LVAEVTFGFLVNAVDSVVSAFPSDGFGASERNSCSSRLSLSRLKERDEGQEEACEEAFQISNLTLCLSQLWRLGRGLSLQSSAEASSS